MSCDVPLTDPPGLEPFLAEIRGSADYKALPPRDINRAHVAAFEAMLRALYEDGATGNGFSIEFYDKIRGIALRKERPLKDRVLAVAELIHTLEREVLGRRQATRC